MATFSDAIGCLLHGLLQRILIWIPLLRPSKEARSKPPDWWYSCWDWSTWYYNIDADGYPSETWCDLYIRCVWRHIKSFILAEAEIALQGVKNFLRDLIGYISPAFSSLGAWVNSIALKVGWSLPDWATSVVGGLWRLWGLFPDSISEARQTWDQIWENIKQAVKSWAHARYEDARQWATRAWDWLTGIGQAIEQWWRDFSIWLGELARHPYAVVTQILGSAWHFLVDFWQNPTQKVIDWLGPTWPRLHTFARDCLAFWYNIWGTSAAVLVELLDDPLEFIWIRAEQFILRKLE